MSPRVGDVAPDIDCLAHDGKRFHLADHRGQRNVVLFFYPRAFTPGCTAEVCSFRDAYEDLRGQDTEIVGVSTDGTEKQSDFATHHRVPYPLLPDPDGKVSKAYGALGMLRSILGMAKRVTYVIDKQGIVRGVFHHELDIKQHLADVQKTLAALG
jgi:peroxiredoxin Q/BCP